MTLENELDAKLKGHALLYRIYLTFFAFVVLGAGITVLHSFGIGLVKIVEAGRLSQELGPIVLLLGIVVCLFILPATMFFFLLPNRILLKEGRILLLYPFGLRRTVSCNRGRLIYSKKYGPGEELHFVWIPGFTLLAVGSLFYGRADEAMDVILRK